MRVDERLRAASTLICAAESRPPRWWKSALLAIGCLAVSNLPAGAQGSASAESAAVAATSLLRDRLPKGARLVIVPDTTGDTVLAVFVGKTLELPVRTAQEGRSCQGFIPQCHWRLENGMVAVRLTPISVARDTVVLEVEHWTTVASKAAPGEASTKALQFARYRVLVGLIGGVWSVLRIDPQFTT
jgi:hypothetical protein